jgi:hypothetical protein
VQDLLLMLGSFGGECTREETAPIEPTWFDENGNPEVLATWGTAVDYCFAQVRQHTRLISVQGTQLCCRRHVLGG